MKVKAMYGLAELARLSGLSKKRVRSLLMKSGVLKEGGIVYLSDLKQSIPEFWESCLDCESARRIVGDDGQ